MNFKTICCTPHDDQCNPFSALLKIPWDPRSLNMAPVCLPISQETKNETFLDMNCIATGWGQTASQGPLQDRLRQVELRVVETKHCQEMYDMKYNIQLHDDTHVCAGPIMSGGKGTCIVSHMIQNLQD